MDKVADYWINYEIGDNFSVPNVSLFRFIGSLFDSLKDKKVLEIGFLDGADLLECKKRGANIFGIDINPIAVSRIKLEDKTKIKTARCGVDPIPFEETFDLIYLRDTIYYLNEEEIQFFFKDVIKKIHNKGIIIIQFIEKDLSINKQDPLEEFDFNKLNKAHLLPIFEKNNPIRFLLSKELIEKAEKVNLRLIASKRLLQSYDTNEERFRLDRYLAFKSC